SLPGEGTVQVAAASDAGAVCGVNVGRDLEGLDPGRDEEDRSSEDIPRRQVATLWQTTIKERRMRSRGGSARSFAIRHLDDLTVFFIVVDLTIAVLAGTMGVRPLVVADPVPCRDPIDDFHDASKLGVGPCGDPEMA